MFVVYGKPYGSIYENKVQIFGIFSTLEKAKESINIIVDRFVDPDEYDEDDYEFTAQGYRDAFKIVNVKSEIDDDSFFKNGDLPNF
jgi:hypothetical protein